jgi:exodeoxyribonuclease V beta subunit
MTLFALATHRLDRTTTALEASAGTGKTFSLTALVIRLLLEGIADGEQPYHPMLQEILLVTFTNKATDELRTRLRTRLALAVQLWTSAPTGPAFAQALDEDGFLAAYHRARAGRHAEDAARLRAAEAVIDQAPVSTIHGFCARILGEFSGLIGLPADVAVAEDEAERLEAACRDAWRAVVSAHGDAAELALLLGLDDGSDRGKPRLAFATLARDYRAWSAADRPFLAVEPGDARTQLAAWLATDDAGRYAQAVQAWSAACAAREPVRSRAAARRLLFCRIDERLRAGCARDGVLTMDSLLGRLRETLRDAERGPVLAQALSRRYPAALIDEFQDTDPVQAEIVLTAFAGGVLRLIGDPKQSIYRFRGADLHQYLGVVQPSSGRVARIERMGTNYRSAPGCVALVNHLFREERHPFLHPDLAFSPSLAARRVADLDDGPDRQLIWWWLARARRRDAERLLIAATASELARLCANARLGSASGTGSGAPFRPRNAAVLTATHRQAAAVADALRAAGIPAITRSMESVCASEAAGELTTLLLSLADPGDGGRARTALCTRLWGGTQELLAGRPGTLGHDLAELRALARSWRHLGVLGTVSRILRSRKARARLLGEPGGERYLTDLLHVAELSHAAGDRPAVAASWLVHQRETGALGDAERLRLEDDGDAVTVITVHAAKGLEWPVVFASFLWCTPSARDMVVSLSDGGVGSARPVRFRTGAQGWIWDWRSLVDAADADAADCDTRAEAVRQTYVALTRARERTYVAWGPLGAAMRSAARSGLSLIAGMAADGTADRPALRQAQHTALWLWPDEPTQRAAQALSALPQGASKAELCAAARLSDADWKRVSQRLRDLGWAELRNRKTYHPIAPIPAFAPVIPQLADFRAHLGVAPGGIQQVAEPPAAAARTPGPADQRPLSPRRAAIENLREAWTITSFTGLTRGAGEQDLLGALGDERSGASDRRPALGIHAFPAGAGPGDCLHRIIERADLRQPGSSANRALIHAILAGERIAAEHEEAVVDLLAELGGSRIPATQTPLAALPAAQLRHEWPFDLALQSGDAPTGRQRLGGVAAAFRAHADDLLDAQWADRLGALRDHAFHGFLTGRADLIACIDGRWWVIDWKSNRLGTDVEAYTVPAMRDNALEHFYPLQWMIYLVALHRQLRARLPGYDPQRHLGGAAYCYLRGIDRRRPAAGWLVHRPSAAALAAWDAACGGLAAGGGP